MAYKFVKERQFRAIITVVEPGMEPDKPVKSVFTATFKILPTSLVDELSVGRTATAWDDAVAKAALISIEGVQDDAGANVPFTSELVDDLFNHEPARNALVNGYWQYVRNGKARAGN